MAGLADLETEAQIVKSQIDIHPRPGDNVIDAAELRQFDLFRRMKKSVSIEKFPGSIILRTYRKGEVLFQQGQAGFTAFYIPTAEDLARLKALEEGKEPPAIPEVDPKRDLHVLSALIIPATSKPRPRGFFAKWFGSTEKSKAGALKLAAIPNDGPADIDFQTREAPLYEGNLFGEMSCISFMPRSATVVTRRDCKVLEFNRNVFDQIRGDKNHQAVLEEEYRRRTLDTHLRQFELFKGLNESQIQLLKDNVTLEVVPPGNVICEEGERWSDDQPLDVFIVRNGVVQVIVNANISVRAEDIRDWPGLCRLLEDAKPDPKVVVAPSSISTKPVVAGAAAKPASPLDALRQKQAGGQPTEGTTKPFTEVAGTGSSKPSPLDLVRSKQAAQGAPAGHPAVVATDRPQSSSGQGEPPVDSPAKLSPIEQMRAKQAASASVKANAEVTSTTGAGSHTASADVAAASPAKLSPIEQMRAKQAAAAAVKAKAEGSNPAEGGSDTASDDVAAASPAKLSPIELMRSKQAAAKAKEENSGPVESGSTAALFPSAGESPAKISTAVTVGADTDLKQGAGPKSSAPIAAGGNVATPQPVAKEKDTPLVRKPSSDQSGSPVYTVKSWLSESLLEIVHLISEGELRDKALTEAQNRIVKALNELLQNRDFLADKKIVAEIHSRPSILRKSASFPKGLKGIGKEWSEMELRTTGRLALSEIFPNLIRRPVEASGPPRVLAYLSRGECIGEIAVVRGTERNATCIAYNHPSSENPRDFGNVELVRIRGSAFRQLMSQSPELERQVKSLAEKRRKQTETRDEQSTETDLIAASEFQQMGLFQGSRLLVIDLDKCTRCGDCVEACVDTHDDGASRLFLDGPRYDRFLVPSACRNCLNPVCMIGCPVGSIGRGDNGQIEIYDWCIGCAACADQCPYDSIQMHDTGLIPEESSGWLYANRRSLTEEWFRERRLSSGWLQGESPFRWQGEFLRELAAEEFASSKEEPLHLCFRHEFRTPKKSRTQRYRLSVNDARRKGAIEKMRVKTSKLIGVWLNGEKLSLSGNSVEIKSDQLFRGENVLAIEVALEPPAEYGQFVLSACLDAISEVGTQALEVLGKDVHSEMDLVTRRAAVCDLCSHIPSQQPACVSSCPHDAAIRVNPMINFPM